MLLFALLPFSMIYSSNGNLHMCTILHLSVKLQTSAIQADSFKYILKEF